MIPAIEKCLASATDGGPMNPGTLCASLRHMNRSLSRILLLLFAAIALASCSPAYVARAAYEQGKIILGREKILRVLENSGTPTETRTKLQRVLDAREFGTAIGLEVGESFTRYYKLDRPVFAWVLLGSKPDSFSLATWWFPIVGSVPYKGFFDKDDAIQAEQELRAEGYETWLRGTEAMSTLGWFNDPVMSTTLSHDEVSIVGTVLHESFHATVWIPDHVDFNESAANFLGCAATVLFYEQRAHACGDAACRDAAAKDLDAATLSFEREMAVSDTVMKLYERLDALYRSDKSKEAKLEERVAIFNEETAPLKARYPRLKVLQAINNAALMQLKLYETKLRNFERLFAKVGRDPLRFIDEMRDIGRQTERDGTDPFALLEEKMQ